VRDLRAPLDPAKNLGLLFGVVRWDEDGDGLANRLTSGVPEEALGALVPAPDEAVEILTDDRVIRRLDDRGQVAPGGFRRLAPEQSVF